MQSVGGRNARKSLHASRWRLCALVSAAQLRGNRAVPHQSDHCGCVSTWKQAERRGLLSLQLQTLWHVRMWTQMLRDFSQSLLWSWRQLVLTSEEDAVLHRDLTWLQQHALLSPIHQVDRFHFTGCWAILSTNRKEQTHNLQYGLVGKYTLNAIQKIKGHLDKQEST